MFFFRSSYIESQTYVIFQLNSLYSYQFCIHYVNIKLLIT